MKLYTIVGGVNGVGKSSFTGALKARMTDLGTMIDVDKITAELGGKIALKKIRDCLNKGVSFTQDQPCPVIKQRQRQRKRKKIYYKPMRKSKRC